MNAKLPPCTTPRRGRTPMIAGAAVLMAASCLCAQDLPYESGSTGADGPLAIPSPIPARSHHAAAFHAGQGKLVLFGGYSNGSTVTGYGDTLIRNTPTWNAILPAASPPPRYEHVMVYDAARSEIVLFGGNSSGAKLGDTWIWDGTTWTQKNPVTSPAARDGHCMAYDSTRQRVVLFGGSGDSGNLGDTWEWDGSTWTELAPTTSPLARYDSDMTYDPVRQRTVMFGGYGGGNRNDLWEWDGTNWEEKVFSAKPSARTGHAMAFDVIRQEVVLFGGYISGNGQKDTWTYSAVGWVEKFPATTPYSQYGLHSHTLTFDPVLQKVVMVGGASNTYQPGTWLWDGSDWSKESDTSFTFDMTSRNDGVWNYTTIDVPVGVTVNFKKNLTNKAVQWLATGNVTIAGKLDLDGERGRPGSNVESGNEAVSGPGGYKGGLGGRQFSISGSYIGSPGDGPGGGAPGSQGQTGGNGTYSGIYGNTFIQPLIGGSGGGGGSSSDTLNGGNGGAGGGAILIASSTDINVTGEITADGGSPGSTPYSKLGGYGSGGAIRLIADRVVGTGILSATGSGTNGNGRIRVEGYYRPLAAATVSPTPSAGPPTDTFAGLGAGLELTIASVDGTNVRQPPLGDTANPDVIFTDEGVISITVAGTNIPDGTPVTLRLATSAGIQVLPGTGNPAVTMTGNSASFTTTVPAGVGTLQAYATVDATATP